MADNPNGAKQQLAFRVRPDRTRARRWRTRTGELVEAAGTRRVRLLLDEMYSPEIARQLRALGHDVVAVVERPDLVSRSDRDLFELMGHENCAIATNNVADYIVLFSQAIAATHHHHGLLLTDDRSMPRRRNAVGTFVHVLDDFLGRDPDEGALKNQLRWLP